ncbi:MAG: cryptochrome/photolyase family protein [Pseudomonadota bacterium]
MSDKNLILILGDQLSSDLASLRAARKTKDVILMGELADEATYVKHHKKKIAFLFSAMRHFAEDLRANNYTVDYQKLDAKNAAKSFTELVKRAVKKHKPDKIIVVEPGEHRLRAEFAKWETNASVPVEVLEDDRFFCSLDEFNAWAEGRKSLRMEFFYREMRKKTGLLMDGDAPAGGEWNFDKENRKPPKSGLDYPDPPQFKPDSITRDVIDLVSERFDDHFGDVEPFWFAVTSEDAEIALDYFIEHALPRFGDYQDAMVSDEKFLFHSVLSPYINAGLLSPKAVCERAQAAYEAGDAPINAVEGFIRQILGWREYVRGIYWRGDKGYVKQNFFEADRPLPEFFWSGKTEMACVAAAVNQTREEAYAHHIQRLMVTGNFALIAGLDPHAVHEWYLEVYADAYEWVEAPNVIGMSLFADGGGLGSKPYAASGAYINRMSDYCKNCRYSVSKKTEEDACPFNALYWDFLIRNRKKLEGNGRLSRVYQNWERMDADKKRAYRACARGLLDRLDRGGEKTI